MVVAASRPRTGFIATSCSWVALFVGAFAMFSQMQDALNAAWDVKPDPNRSLFRSLLARLPAFAMVFVIAVLLFLLVVITTVLTSLSQYAAHR